MKFGKTLAVASFALAFPLLFIAQFAWADDNKTVTVGTSVTLRWTIVGADECRADGDWTGTKTASQGAGAGETITKTTPGVYRFTCTAVNGGNTSTATLTVTCPADRPTWSGGQCVATTPTPATTPDGTCRYNGPPLRWGAGNECKSPTGYDTGIVQNNQTATAPNDAPGYIGSITYRCSSGSWIPVSSPCARACGTAIDGGPVGTAPTTNLCAEVLTASSVTTGTSEYSWTCASGGNSSTCTIPRLAVCGTDHEQILNRIPTNLCAPGVPSSISTSATQHNYTWTCSSGVSGGNVVSCFADSAGLAVCGTTHNNCIPSTATSLPISGGMAGPWTWRCTSADGIPVNCSQARASTGGLGGTSPASIPATPRPSGPCTVQPAQRVYWCDGSYLVERNNCRIERGIFCPSGCSNGECRNPVSSFVPFDAISNVGSRGTFQATGELLVKPMLIRRGDPTWIYWNVKDALCTVTGNGQTWSSPTCGAGFESCGNNSYATNVKNISDDTTGAVTWDCLSSGSLGTGARTSCYRHNPIDGRVITCTPACNTSCTDTCIPPQYGGAPCGDLVTRSGGTCSSGLSTSDILEIINRVPNRLDSEIARDLINANVSPEAAKNALGDSNLNARVDEAFQDARNSQ